MTVLILYVIITTFLSYFILEKISKVEDGTLYILTPLFFAFGINLYSEELFNLKDKSILNEIGDLISCHLIVLFLSGFTHFVLITSFNYIFKNFKIKLIDGYKNLLFDDIKNKNEIKNIYNFDSIKDEAITDLSKKISLAIHMIIAFVILLLIISPYLFSIIKHSLNH